MLDCFADLQPIGNYYPLKTEIQNAHNTLHTAHQSEQCMARVTQA